MGIDHPAGVIKNIVPIVMAGVLGIYGLIVSVIITQAISTPTPQGNAYSTYNGYTHVSMERVEISCLSGFESGYTLCEPDSSVRASSTFHHNDSL